MNTDNQKQNNQNENKKPEVSSPEVAKVEETKTETTEESVTVGTPDVLTTVEKVTEVEVVETANSTATAVAPEVSAARKNWMAFAAGLVVALVAWYTYNIVTTVEKKGATENYPAVVAKVNGEKISGEDFERGLTQTENVALSQGVDTSGEEGKKILEEQAMIVITNTRLLVQVAKEKGYTAGEEEVAEQLAAIEAQFGSREALLAEADKFGISPEDLEDDIAEQIAVDKYLRETVVADDITIEESAIRAAYDTVAATSPEIPAYEDVRDAIEGQLKGEKQQELIANHLEELRAEAKIDILI